MVNPQVSTPYFTVQLPVYNGDKHSQVVDRIRRTSGVPGNLKMELFRYETDSRSIPMYGATNGVERIGHEAKFQLSSGSLVLVDGDTSQFLGTHMQYTVDMS